jgi:hypothetical protein
MLHFDGGSTHRTIYNFGVVDLGTIVVLHVQSINALLEIV